MLAKLYLSLFSFFSLFHFFHKKTCLEQLKQLYSVNKNQNSKIKKDMSKILPTVGLNGEIFRKHFWRFLNEF
jgi:hypothetical protein